MTVALTQFVDDFVLPLLGGGPVAVHDAFSARDRDSMMGEAEALNRSDLLFARLRRAKDLVASPNLPYVSGEELGLWLGLNNILFLDHPDSARVWAGNKRWQQVEAETRALLLFSHPSDMPAALSRHVAVGAFLELARQDHIVRTSGGERRFLGQPVRLGLFSGAKGEQRAERVRWIQQAHAPAVDRLSPIVFSVSPLTCLLDPGYAPEGWSPVAAADFLRVRPYARAICHHWAADDDWLRRGSVLAGSLLRGLGLLGTVFGLPGELRLDVPPEDSRGLALPESPDAAKPEDIAAIVGALTHLHALKVLELDARVNLGSTARDWAVQTFLALPLILPSLEATLGTPFDTSPDARVRARWEEYVEHVRSMVPRGVVENLVAMLVPRIVERASA